MVGLNVGDTVVGLDVVGSDVVGSEVVGAKVGARVTPGNVYYISGCASLQIYIDEST